MAEATLIRRVSSDVQCHLSRDGAKALCGFAVPPPVAEHDAEWCDASGHRLCAECMRRALEESA